MIEEIYARFLECSGVERNSRVDLSDKMFLGIAGDRFDGSDFAHEALLNGAKYALVHRTSSNGSLVDPRILWCDDVTSTLQDLARHHRKQMTQCTVIGITGSNGKTTTKELCFSVLSAEMPGIATKGNLNNHIGVPLTVLEIKRSDLFAIVEMGANAPGDIAELTNIALPTVGLITNIGFAHMEGFGNIDGVLATKRALFDCIVEGGGVFFYDAKELRIHAVAKTYNGSRPFLPASEGDSFSGLPAKLFSYTPGKSMLAEIEVDGEVYSTRLFGNYNAQNIGFAVALGRHFGIDDTVIKQALALYSPANNRSQVLQTEAGNTLVVDAYNANPSSVSQALTEFSRHSNCMRSLVILGDMMESGERWKEVHQSIVEQCKEIWKSDQCLFIGHQYREANKDRFGHTFKDVEEAKAFLSSSLVLDKEVFIKGSRSMRLEQLIEVL